MTPPRILHSLELYYWNKIDIIIDYLLFLFFKGHQYSKVRRALHSSHPDNLLCREKEIADIRSFLHNHLPKGKPGSLYISGAPGTGKTACLTRIMLEMKVNEMTMIKAKSLDDSLKFIRLLRVVFSSQQRREWWRLEVIGWNSGYLDDQGLSCTLVTCLILGWSW